jgi:hypothetical protein
MNKEWFILIEDLEEGPYSSQDLVADYRVTLETLVWKEGFPKWIPVLQVYELRQMIEKRPQAFASQDSDNTDDMPMSIDAIALEASGDPSNKTFIFLILFVIAIYLIYKLCT